MLAIEVNHKWDAYSIKNSTQALVHPHIKLSKYRTWIIWTWWKWLDEILMYPQERFAYYKRPFWHVLCYKKDWAILLHLIYFYYLLPVTNYLITKLSVTDNSNACREYLTENCLSFPSAPHWVRHSYLSKNYDRSPYTCGSSAWRRSYISLSGPLGLSFSALLHLPLSQ